MKKYENYAINKNKLKQKMNKYQEKEIVPCLLLKSQ